MKNNEIDKEENLKNIANFLSIFLLESAKIDRWK